MRLGERAGVGQDGAVHDHGVDVQAAIPLVTLVAAHVRGDRRPAGRRSRPPPGRGRARRKPVSSPVGDVEPVAVHDRLVLDADGLDGAAVPAEPDDQPRRRDRLRHPDPHQAELGPDTGRA